MIKVLRAAVLAVVLGVLSSAVASAAPYETPFFRINMPDNWTLLQTEDLNYLDIAVFVNAKRDTTVECIVGGGDRLTLQLVAECYAEQYNAKKPISVGKDVASFNYTTFEGLPGSARIVLANDAFLVTTIGGDQTEGHKFLRNLEAVAPYEAFALVK